MTINDWEKLVQEMKDKEESWDPVARHEYVLKTFGFKMPIEQPYEDQTFTMSLD